MSLGSQGVISVEFGLGGHLVGGLDGNAVFEFFNLVFQVSDKFGQSSDLFLKFFAGGGEMLLEIAIFLHKLSFFSFQVGLDSNTHASDFFDGGFIVGTLGSGSHGDLGKRGQEAVHVLHGLCSCDVWDHSGEVAGQLN